MGGQADGPAHSTVESGGQSRPRPGPEAIGRIGTPQPGAVMAGAAPRTRQSRARGTKASTRPRSRARTSGPMQRKTEDPNDDKATHHIYSYSIACTVIMRQRQVVRLRHLQTASEGEREGRGVSGNKRPRGREVPKKERRERARVRCVWVCA